MGSFASYKPVATFTDDLGQEVRTAVLGRNHFSFWVALSAIDLTGAQAKITHLERYSSFGTERSPLLHVRRQAGDEQRRDRIQGALRAGAGSAAGAHFTRLS